MQLLTQYQISFQTCTHWAAQELATNYAAELTMLITEPKTLGTPNSAPTWVKNKITTPASLLYKLLQQCPPSSNGHTTAMQQSASMHAKLQYAMCMCLLQGTRARV